MHFIDTHCHLDAAEFGNTQAALVAAAQHAGVNCIVLPAVERANFQTVLDLGRQHDCCAPALGIHPMYVAHAKADDLAALDRLLQASTVIAVGEIGLDFFVEHYDQPRQEEFFIAQLKLARKYNLPVLLHVRKSVDTILKYLRQIRVPGGIAHAFNGSRQQADEFIKLGFKLGFGGAMTYTRANRLRDLAATLPLEAIVLETDAPDIPPAFLERGMPNKPEYLPRIAHTLAELRCISLPEIAAATSANAIAVLPGLTGSLSPATIAR